MTSILATFADGRTIAIDDLPPAFYSADPELRRADMSVFKEVTYGKPILMGRVTWDTLKRKPLKGRGHHYIYSRMLQGDAGENASYVSDDFVPPEDSVCIGGGLLYKKFIPLCDKVYVNVFRFNDPLFFHDKKVTKLCLDELLSDFVLSDSKCFSCNGGTIEFLKFSRKKF